MVAVLRPGQHFSVLPSGLMEVRAFGPAGAAVNPLLTGLVAYWNMNETSGTRADSHTSSLDLTDNNTVAYVAGKVGNAAHFDDANSEYLSRADCDDLGVAGDTDFTFAFWFNQLDQWTTDYWITKYQGGGTNNDEYYIAWSGEKPTFLVRGTDNSTQTVAWGSKLGVATWYFCVCWRDGTNIYIDINDSGSEVSAAWSTNQKNSTQDFYMGRLGGTYAEFYLDEVGFWKRVLSAAERTELYNSGNGTTYPF
jgi:hypothetical protein